MTNGSELVTYERVGAAAVVKVNRPRSLNALTPQLVDALVRAVERATAEDVAAMILAGNGRAFCAGHDLHEVQDPHEPELNRRELERIQDITRAIRVAPHPVIAAVHGYALGAGFEISLGCDLLIASVDAIFGFPEVSVGLSVTGGVTRLLPLMVGSARAKELILLGGHVSATRCSDLGLVNEVVEPEALMPRALELARRLADLPQASLRAAKRSLDHGCDAELAAALSAEVDVAMSLIGVDQQGSRGDEFRVRHRG